MTINNVVDFGKSKGACVEALRWLSTQTDAEQAWLTCERPDWMIWYAARRGVDRNVLVRIACDCARTASRFVPAGEDRPRIAIETTERWIAGEATIAEVRLTPTPDAARRRRLRLRLRRRRRRLRRRAASGEYPDVRNCAQSH